MRVEVFDQRVKFREAARLVLDQEPLENCLASDVMGQLEHYETLRLLVIVDAGRWVGIAIQTLPHPMQVVAAPEARESAPAALAESLVEAKENVRLVMARQEVTEAFAAAWRKAGGLASPRRRLGFYRCPAVNPPNRPASGALRHAAAAEESLLIDWVDRFHREIHTPASDPVTTVRRRLATESLYVWVDGGRPVSMLCGGAGDGPARVGMVFTPAELRGHGYATSAVAALTQHLLDLGKTCVLFADNDNPGPSGIYRRIGYRTVCDFLEISLELP